MTIWLALTATQTEYPVLVNTDLAVSITPNESDSGTMISFQTGNYIEVNESYEEIHRRLKKAVGQ